MPALGGSAELLKYKDHRRRAGPIVGGLDCGLCVRRVMHPRGPGADAAFLVSWQLPVASLAESGPSAEALE